MNNSRAIDVGIFLLRFTQGLERHRFKKRISEQPGDRYDYLLVQYVRGCFRMSEETLAFVIIIVPLAISMGYDSITGLYGLCCGPLGFAGAILNPFTIGIAQDFPTHLCFRFEYRLFCWFCSP